MFTSHPRIHGAINSGQTNMPTKENVEKTKKKSH